MKLSDLFRPSPESFKVVKYTRLESTLIWTGILACFVAILVISGGFG